MFFETWYTQMLQLYAHVSQRTCRAYDFDFLGDQNLFYPIIYQSMVWVDWKVDLLSKSLQQLPCDFNYVHKFEMFSS